MFSLCRLCATCTDPIELITEMTELEPKLVHCFGWRRSEKEMEMPKKACNSCVDYLHRSYEFVETMLSAEKQLNKLLSEQIPTISDADEIFPETVEIKLEDAKRRMSDVPEPGASEALQEYANVDNDHKNSIVEYDDYDDGIFGEPVDYSDDDSKSDSANKNSTKIEPKKRSRKKQPASEPFLDALIVEDRLSNGQISANGVQKLEKLFPEMKTMSWQDCQYKCEKCDRIFRGSINYYSHIRSVHIEDILSIVVPCFYCNSKHRREFKLNRHIATDHFPHLKYRCPLCPDYYWDPHELVKHRNMHTNLQYTCETCGLAFGTRESFYAHCTSHVTKRKERKAGESFICEICNKHFKSKGSIRNHMLLHTDKYDHVCEQCGWKFQSKGNLKGHLASTHAISKPFQCDKCSKYFKTKHQLKNHSIIHEENYTPFTCTFCAASFRRKSTLKVHMRSHTNVCPYTCRHCGKSFRHGITLQTHERAHTNDKPYGCTHCEYRCTSKGNLNKHMMRAHSIDFRNHKIKKEN